MIRIILLNISIILPAICFSRSVMITTVSDSTFNSLKVKITDSMDMKETVVNFRLYDGEIVFSISEQEFLDLKEQLKIIFPQAYTKKWEATLLSGSKGNKTINADLVLSDVRKLAVWENYQITSSTSKKIIQSIISFCIFTKTHRNIHCQAYALDTNKAKIFVVINLLLLFRYPLNYSWI